MSRLVVFAVLVLAAAALVDSLRHEGRERAVAGPALPSEDDQTLVRGRAGLVVADNRILRGRTEYLSRERIKAAFPAPLLGSGYHLAHVATAPDGTVAVAAYNFTAAGPDRNSIELWRAGDLVSSFVVPPGSFGGGLGFSGDGDFVAAVSPDGRRATLFDRRGRRVDIVPVTRW